MGAFSEILRRGVRQQIVSDGQIFFVPIDFGRPSYLRSEGAFGVDLSLEVELSIFLLCDGLVQPLHEACRDLRVLLRVQSRLVGEEVFLLSFLQLFGLPN